MRIVNTNNTINVRGYVDRVEKGYSVKHVNNEYIKVREPIIVQKPKIEDFNNLVVVHDQVEVYV